MSSGTFSHIHEAVYLEATAAQLDQDVGASCQGFALGPLSAINLTASSRVVGATYSKSCMAHPLLDWQHYSMASSDGNSQGRRVFPGCVDSNEYRLTTVSRTGQALSDNRGNRPNAGWHCQHMSCKEYQLTLKIQSIYRMIYLPPVSQSTDGAAPVDSVKQEADRRLSGRLSGR